MTGYVAASTRSPSQEPQGRVRCSRPRTRSAATSQCSSVMPQCAQQAFPWHVSRSIRCPSYHSRLWSCLARLTKYQLPSARCLAVVRTPRASLPSTRRALRRNGSLTQQSLCSARSLSLRLRAVRASCTPRPLTGDSARSTTRRPSTKPCCSRTGLRRSVRWPPHTPPSRRPTRSPQPSPTPPCALSPPPPPTPPSPPSSSSPTRGPTCCSRTTRRRTWWRRRTRPRPTLRGRSRSRCATRRLLRNSRARGCTTGAWGARSPSTRKSAHASRQT
mmetsp:Transcript_17227/g.44138  ORF Transcript_17227/g.44138 Transcript_17227/m.44138 type:complete len:274 (+) Transcript_17227:917-1738(+)